jgi:hypothetical protein
MHQESKQTRDNAERLVVIDLLGQTRGRSCVVLYRHLGHYERTLINSAIEGLVEAGVLARAGERVIVTPALACLEQLDLIAI